MNIRTHKVLPNNFPAEWASHWGEDEYGLYMGFTYREVSYTFRWIEPGTFLMGSPEDEPGHHDNETQHEVTLSQGFWLGDTCVTQALWEVFMEDNPSQFKDPERPVENVSWNDAQRFIEHVNGLKASLKLALPTEAEWEYACRAGTTTAFSFGGKDDLNLERVNYSGEWEGFKLQGEAKSVRSYPVNPWGLYEMHGNVWEWCQDCFDGYPQGPVTDPAGASSGDHRVLRGGSWFVNGRVCRSACRGRGGPDNRLDDDGFRLASRS